MKTGNERQAAAPPPGPHAPLVVRFSLPAPLIVFFGLLLVLPWLAAGVFFLANQSSGSRALSVFSQHDGLGAVKPAAARTAQGPWGTLQIEPIIVEPPSTFFSFNFDVSPGRRWLLSNAAPDQARALLARAGLDGTAIETLLKTGRPEPAGLALWPPDDLVRALPPRARAALYSELGRNPANPFHAAPFRFRGPDLADWFAHCDLPDDIIRQIQPLLYTRHEYLCFTDVHLVLPAIDSPLQRIRLLQTLHREKTFRLRLQIKPGDPLDALLAYWGRGGRRYEIEPILQSARNRPDGEMLDITYLLPGFARTRLYTYINPTRGTADLRRDCHWTSLNFFNEIPDNRYGRLTDLTDVALQDYQGINSPMEFGDIIFFLLPSKAAIHSCVYIADNIVFTKNGVGFGRPFIFERLENVINSFREDAGEFFIQYCRRRERGE